jgi:imidazolonepropionase-like amidohydrolase
MNMLRWLVAFFLIAWFAPAETKVLRNFTLIDGNGGPPTPASAMVITDGRIKWVGPAAGLKLPAGAEVIELAGKYVMPGIINSHGHLGNVAGLVEDRRNYTRESVEKQLKIYASYGVTSVLSWGLDQELIYDLRASQRASRPVFTRVFTAGRGLKFKDGYPASPGMKGVPYEVTNAQEIEKAVKELAGWKVDFVKMWVDDHLGHLRKMPMDLCRAIIVNANKQGLRSIAHVHYLADAKQLTDAGIYGLGHSVRDALVDEELIASMKKRGTWLAAATLTREMSTFIYAKPHPILEDPFLTRSISPEVLQALKSSYRQTVLADPDLKTYPTFIEFAKKNLKKMVDAGVKVAFGTDTGPPARFPGYFEHWEMELMKEAGLTPAQIITMASRNSAEFLGVSKDLGTLEAGKWADLIVLKGNPLADIRNTRTIEFVLIAGNRI